MNGDWQALKRNVTARQQAEAALAAAHREVDEVRTAAAAELAKNKAAAAELVAELRVAVKTSGQTIGQLTARLERLQADLKATFAELAGSKAEVKGLEKMRNALEQNIEVMRKEHAEQQKILATMVADFRAASEAVRPLSAPPIPGYTLEVVDRDANNDMRKLRIVPSKGSE